MPLDFPNSPTLNQSYTSAGISWSWDGVKWLNVPQVGASNPSLNNVGRNLLHNPLFNVAQRGAGPFTAGYSLDRWLLGVSGSGLSVTQLALVDADRTAIADEAARWALQSVCTGTAGANDLAIVAQNIEDVRRLSGKTVTLSFWAKATAGTPKLAIELAQSFGTGGSPSAIVAAIGSQAFTLSTSWTRYSATITMPSAAGKTFGTTAGTDNTSVNLWQSAGSTFASRASSIGQQSYTLQLWGVQLEVGSVATPLEKPDPQQDLAKAQRYFCNVSIASDYTQGTTSTSMYRAYKFPTTMRALPTVTPTGGSWTYYSAGNTTAFTPTVGSLSVDFISIIGTGLTNANGFIGGTFIASADL